MENEEKITTGEVAVQSTGAKPKDSLSIPLAIVFSGLLIAAAILFTEKTVSPVAPMQQVPPRAQAGADVDADVPTAILTIRADDHVLGNPKADVLVIEYSDAQCPFCQRFHETMIKIMADYGKTGGVAWVYRHSPIDQIHPYARKAAEAMECAAELGGNEGFWKFESVLFSADTESLAPEALPLLATKAGLDATKFNTCVTSGKYADRVQKDFMESVEVGVNGTPHSIVWNQKTGKQMRIKGALPYDTVKTILAVVSASQVPK